MLVLTVIITISFAGMSIFRFSAEFRFFFSGLPLFKKMIFRFFLLFFLNHQEKKITDTTTVGRVPPFSTFFSLRNLVFSRRVVCHRGRMSEDRLFSSPSL